jgi:DeoR family transcriptional regulator of aga operon
MLATMIPAQRRARVLELVSSQGAVAVGELSAKLGISLSTVRRDLDYLTEQGYLERSHGGAIITSRPASTFEPKHEISRYVAVPAKTAIGQLAAQMVSVGQSVILDSSTTVRGVAHEVVRRQIEVTAVTNDIGIASVLAIARNVRLFVIGGALRPDSLTLIGDPGQSFLDGLEVDLAFIGAHAIGEAFISETSVDVAANKQRMVRAARKVVVVADGSKFGQAAFCKVVDLADIDAVVTDGSAPEPTLAALRARNIEVLVADAGVAA